MSKKSIGKVELKRTKISNPKETGKRIEELRGQDSVSRFAKRLGVAHTTIKRYEDGHMLPSIDLLMRISALTGRSVEWLVTGKARAGIDSGGTAFPEPLLPETLPDDEYFTIPMVDGAIAAGEPIITDENISEWVVVHINPIKKRGSQIKNLVACKVQGDSMSPRLGSGDVVVIDRGIEKNKILRDKMYAVWVDGGLTAKLLQKEGHNLFLLPLNPSEPVRVVDLRENSQPVVGVIIAGWRNF